MPDWMIGLYFRTLAFVIPYSINEIYVVYDKDPNEVKLTYFDTDISFKDFINQLKDK